MPEPARLVAHGADFLTEIREQPAALRALLEHESSYARVATIAREREATTIRMVGHGSSDNAASYGVYAFGLLPRWTALRDSITLTVHYDTPLDLSGSVVIGLSQSGRTPDVVEYVARARRSGAFTIALTNDTSSAQWKRFLVAREIPSASVRLRSNHIANRKRLPTCGSASLSNRDHVVSRAVVSSRIAARALSLPP